MQHDFTLAANGTQTIDVAGRFFKYKSGTGKIRVRATKGGYIDLEPGQGVENEEFTSLTISDRTGLPNSGVILAGNFNFRDETISGTVNVVDNGKSRVLAGICYISGPGVGAVVSQYGYVQLWNPVGSVKNLIVEQIFVSSSNPAEIDFGLYASPLATLHSKPLNKKFGPAPLVTVAESRTENTVASYVGSSMGALYVPQAQSIGIKLTVPIVVMPGQGLTVKNWLQGAVLSANFEYYEDPI